MGEELKMTNGIKKRGIDKIRYDRAAKFYDQFESLMELFAFTKWREHLFERMKPKKEELVLEIGVGTGKNILFYKEGKYISFDISEKMISKAKDRAKGKDVQLLVADAEFIPFKDDTFDIIFSTFVFCSVENPLVGLKEACRVLKPGGKAFFLEHMLPESRVVQPVFHILNPLVRVMGPEINRRTDENIKKAGFEIIRQENLFFTVFRLIEARKLS
jgi:demethylmenaquinone methyltransferase/2-methoxy-6-polyprenyl-1,4-benzoquinol methylase